MKWTEIERFILEGRALDPLTGQVLLPTVYDGTVMAVYKLEGELARYVEDSIMTQPWYVIHIYVDQEPPFFDKSVRTAYGPVYMQSEQLNGLLADIQDKEGWLLVRQRDKSCGVQRRLIC